MAKQEIGFVGSKERHNTIFMKRPTTQTVALSSNMHPRGSLLPWLNIFFPPVLSSHHRRCLFFRSACIIAPLLHVCPSLFLSGSWFFSSVEPSDCSLGWLNGALSPSLPRTHPPPWSASTAAPNSLGAFSTKAAAEVKQKQKPTLCTAAAAIDQSGDGSWRSQFNRRRRCTRFSFFTQRMQSHHTKNPVLEKMSNGPNCKAGLPSGLGGSGSGRFVSKRTRSTSSLKTSSNLTSSVVVTTSFSFTPMQQQQQQHLDIQYKGRDDNQGI